MSTRLQGKVALISGGAQGLGAAFGRAIVEAGGRAVLADVNDPAGDALAQELGPERARYVHLDVTSREGWSAAVDTTVSVFGELSVLVNNAGVMPYATIDDLSSSDWDRALAVNLTGAYLGIQACLAQLRRSAPASIINISSTAGLVGSVGTAAYSTTKFGLRGLTKSVAAELGSTGVRANTIHPGLIATPLIADVPDAVLAPQIGVVGRVGQPTEIASLVVYLASDESSYSTGAEFVADGGATAIR